MPSTPGAPPFPPTSGPVAHTARTDLPRAADPGQMAVLVVENHQKSVLPMRLIPTAHGTFSHYGVLSMTDSSRGFSFEPSKVTFWTNRWPFCEWNQTHRHQCHLCPTKHSPKRMPMVTPRLSSRRPHGVRRRGRCGHRWRSSGRGSSRPSLRQGPQAEGHGAKPAVKLSDVGHVL